ncbi:hypothetical protein CEP88_06005 [Roseobacter denitrificans]|uniref:Lipoprotein, putative n=1 Tax=Roseobacter denitrificans (strain ATCC 33942 / OCh 114) TaxID=375451 RepID=Q163R5_ROSDO|nr:hypothetical protein [Roseobacter denitrificans]ABG32778.1 lipoprotein, putative [Roseobacter denitrificans OCh 114]AVL52189.1 hypothetical protein CEP88_06005 [Roseobacter denitrificans]SFF94822.1 hypothetical protein SAMN05443635_104192 [Roseobacter denitrificans OCh 114]
MTQSPRISQLSRDAARAPETRRCESVFRGAGTVVTLTHGTASAQKTLRVWVAGQSRPQLRDFARHLRTKVHEEGGAWSADAVYTKSPTLPDRRAKSDAGVVQADCEQSGIPMV